MGLKQLVMIESVAKVTVKGFSNLCHEMVTNQKREGLKDVNA